uniref:O-antigen polymerase n=1 Tax=Algoriphagus sp. TaxID=1872435 RepID=UPI0040478948
MLIIAIAIFITFFEIIFNFGFANLILITSCILLIILAVPVYMSKNDNLFSILPFLFYFVFLNVFMRNLYIIHNLPNPDYVKDIFLLNENLDFIFIYQLIIVLSFIFFTFGYLIYPEKKLPEKAITQKIQWNNFRYNLVCVIFILISIFSFAYFIYTSNSNLLTITLENISGYRGISDDLGEYNANGLIRLMIQLSVVVFYLSYVRSRFPDNSKLNNLFILVSGTVALFYFFYTQSRSGFIYIFINCFILNYFIRKNFITKKKILLLFVLVVSSFAFMTSIRKGNGYNLEQNLGTTLLSIFDPLVANNGGIDISKTGHIIKYINKEESFKFGSSYLWIVQSFIPRSLWTTKPVNIDTEVGFKIYDANTYGTGAVPPGLIAESYWNFGYLGIVFISLLAGFFLKLLSNYFNERINDLNTLIIYVICFMPIGLALFGSSISSTVIGILYYIVPFILFFKLVTKKKVKNSHSICV